MGVRFHKLSVDWGKVCVKERLHSQQHVSRCAGEPTPKSWLQAAPEAEHRHLETRAATPPSYRPVRAASELWRRQAWRNRTTP